MKLTPINAGFFKLDGGAMFGVVPKSLWQRTNPADEHNMCTWATRCLLVEDGDQKILIDTGIGDKQSEKFFSHYYLHGDDSLLGNLAKAGVKPEDITDVVFTHLHFDHCGGAVQWYDRAQEIPELVFKNATHWTNDIHWKWAIAPNKRERASFLKENILPIEESGQLKFIERGNSPFKNITFFWANGHTMAQMIPVIDYHGQTVVYAADLLPSAGHIPLPYVMGFDVQPLETLKEKEAFLSQAADEGDIIMLEHDPENECCTVQHTPKGVRLKDIFKLVDI